jgi:hypothetical protein
MLTLITRSGSPLHTLETNCWLRQDNFNTATIAPVEKLTLGWKTAADSTYQIKQLPGTNPGLYLGLSELTSIKHLCITDIPSNATSNTFYCEVSRSGVRVELGTGHPNAQIEQINIDGKMTIQLVIEQSILKSTIEMPTQSRFRILPNSPGLLDNYLKALRKLYEESNELKRVLSSHSAVIQQLISKFNHLGVLFSYPEALQRLKKLKDRLEILEAEYPELPRLVHQSFVLKYRLESYSQAIKKLTEESSSLKVLLNSKDDLNILIDKCLAVIQSVNYSDSLKIILDAYSKVDRKPYYLSNINEMPKCISDNIQLKLSLLNEHYFTLNEQVEWSQSTIQQLLKE